MILKEIRVSEFFSETTAKDRNYLQFQRYWNKNESYTGRSWDLLAPFWPQRQHTAEELAPSY